MQRIEPACVKASHKLAKICTTYFPCAKSDKRKVFPKNNFEDQSVYETFTLKSGPPPRNCVHLLKAAAFTNEGES